MDLNQDRGVSRRTVAKGMAWSVPAVAVATAAPAMASSGGGPTLTFVSSCKFPGGSCGAALNKGYKFTYQVCNPTSKDVYIYGATITDTESKMGLAFVKTSPAATDTAGLLIPKNGGCVTVNFYASSTNSANQTYTLKLTVPWGHTLNHANDTEHQPIVSQVLIDSFEPCVGC